MATPAFDVEFTRDGEVFQSQQVDTLLASLGPFTDLLVLSHGWNNDKAEATTLYDDLLANVDKLLALRNHAPVPSPLVPFVDSLGNRSFAAVRIFWPSKKFTDKELIPGGGAASAEAEVENVAALQRALDRLAEDPRVLGGSDRDPGHVNKMEEAKKLVPKLALEAAAKKKFVKLLRGVLDDSMKETDDASAGFFMADAEMLFANAQQPVNAPASGASGGGTSVGNGGAASLGDLLSGAQAAARRLANFATYYQMKSRAGTVGSKGVASLLKRIREAKPTINIHLAGHSFGGRLVTAAANALPANTSAQTLSLLQAAFSHNGLSAKFGDGNTGFFRAVIDDKKISGPIIITHTKNDKAVGIAYPLASRIAGQNAAALGDQNDPYGGMGRNGAQNTNEADNKFTLGLPGTAYSFKSNRIHNISSDIIQDHSDVTRIEVAYAVLSAAGSIGTLNQSHRSR